MNRCVIDRIEEGMAVLENIESMKTVVLPAAALPLGIHEGSTLTLVGRIFVLTEDEGVSDRSLRIREKMERLKKKDR